MTLARLSMVAATALLALSATACERERAMRKGEPVEVSAPTAADQTAAAKAVEEAKADSAGDPEVAPVEGAAPTEAVKTEEPAEKPAP
jgi:hypothetical protein